MELSVEQVRVTDFICFADLRQPEALSALESMDRIDLNIAKSYVHELGLPKIICDIIADEIPSHLRDTFSSPMIYRLTENEQKAYGFGKVFPLMANTNGNIIFSYDFNRNDYFSFFWDGEVGERYSWNELMESFIGKTIERLWDEKPEKELIEDVKTIFKDFNLENIDTTIQALIDGGT